MSSPTPSQLNHPSGLPLREQPEKLIHPYLGVIKTRTEAKNCVKINAFDKLQHRTRCQDGMVSDSYHLPLLTSTSESNESASENDAPRFAYAQPQAASPVAARSACPHCPHSLDDHDEPHGCERCACEYIETDEQTRARIASIFDGIEIPSVNGGDNA